MPNKITVTVGQTYIMRFTNPDVCLDRVVEEFAKIGEGVVARRIQTPKGILLLQMRRDDPESGAIYVYDRSLQEFHLLYFDGYEGNELGLTVHEFDRLVSECDLLRLAERPQLLQPTNRHADSSPWGELQA